LFRSICPVTLFFCVVLALKLKLREPFFVPLSPLSSPIQRTCRTPASVPRSFILFILLGRSVCAEPQSPIFQPTKFQVFPSPASGLRTVGAAWLDRRLRADLAPRIAHSTAGSFSVSMTDSPPPRSLKGPLLASHVSFGFHDSRNTFASFCLRALPSGSLPIGPTYPLPRLASKEKAALLPSPTL